MNIMMAAFRCTCVLLMMSCLCACSTKYARRHFDDYRHYQAWELDYREQGDTGSRLVEPVIYRCGSSWYMAAFKTEVRPKRVEKSLLYIPDRQAFEMGAPPKKGDAVFYHRITPKMADHLLHPFGKGHISDDMLLEDMRRAGGAWSARLPNGAQAIPAPYLRAVNRRVRWTLTESRIEGAPWYKYPLSGVSYVLCDVPEFVLDTSGAIILMPVRLIGSYMAQREDVQAGEVIVDEVLIPTRKTDSPAPSPL